MATASLRGSTNFLSLLPKRYASSAASASSHANHTSATPAHDKPATEAYSPSRPRRSFAVEPLQVTKLENGLTVASIENGSPVARFAAVVNVGARDEARHEVGATHALRVYANLATKNFSTFGISRNLDQQGAEFSVTSTREQTTYLLEATRDKILTCVGIMGDVLSQPELRHWEIDRAHSRLSFDLDLYDAKLELKLVDLIHQAAFRNGLSRPLFAPRDQHHNLDSELLQHFHQQHFTNDRISLIGVGMSHDSAIRMAKYFRLSAQGGGANAAPTKREQAKYLGNEVRQDVDSDLVHVALAAEGVSYSSNEALASGIASAALGCSCGPSIKYSAGYNKLSKAVMPLAKEPALVSAFSANYSDTGLFGIQLVADKNDVGKLTKAVTKELATVGKKGFSAEEIKSAKHKFMVAHLLSIENTSNLIGRLGTNINEIKYKTADEFIKAVDAVSGDDVNKFIKKISGAKQSMAAIGNLVELPYLDELKA